MHRPLALLALLALAATGCGPNAVAAGGDWPQFRGPTANGIAPDTGINKSWNTKPPKILWKVALSDDGYAGPSVADGKVFVIDHQGKNDIVRAINIANGEDEWQFPYEDTDKPNTGFARATPVIDQGRVYTLSRLGMLNCLDIKRGKPIWARDIIKEFNGRRPGWDFSYSPLVDKNKLIVLPGGPNAGVVALDKKTGKTIWQGGPSEVPGYATPVAATILGKPQYVIFTTVGLSGIDASNGKVLWSYRWKTGSDVNAATPIVMGNSVFITSGYNHGCALIDITAEGAKARWENKEMQAHFSSPIIYKGYIYGTGEPGFLMCIDPQTGAAKWKQQGFEKGGVVAVDGVLIAADGLGGDMIMVDLQPDGYKELGRFKPLGGQSWTAPIVAGGKLIVRNTKSLACIALK